MKTLNEYFYGGIDWHDSFSLANTMYYNGTICTKEEDYIPAIADAFFGDMERFFPITKQEFIDILAEVIKTKDRTIVPLYDETEDGTMEVKSFEYGDGQFSYDNQLEVYIEKNDYITIEHVVWGGQMVCYYHYAETNIADSKVAYLVNESFHCPTKGVPVVERCYVPLFDNLQDAENYRKELDKDIEIRLSKNPYPKSESTLNVVERAKVEAGEWYQTNMKANQLMKQKGTNHLGDDFRIFAETHIKELS